MGIGGPIHTKLVNRQFGLVRTLNPVIFNEEAVSMPYEPWEFFRRPKRELSKAHIVEGYFTVSVVSSPSTLQLLKGQQPQQSPESALVDSREGRLEPVISKPSDSDSVSHDVSDIENVNTQIIGSAIPVEMAGKVNLDEHNSPTLAVSSPKKA